MLFFPRKHGILGMNARNLNYLKPFNPKKAVAFADNKLKTKVFLETRGVPVPKLYAKISSRQELRGFDFSQLPNSCVLKPNFGYGGEGILVLTKRERGGYMTASGRHVSYQELMEHIEDILDGMYSLNHRRDTAFFEQVITPHPCFDSLSPSGLPDIRILVHNLVPVMGMMRLPTAESGGKANVHQGGIGLGIDIAKGITTFAVQRNKRIHQLPNGREPGGFQIPHWDEMLLISSRIQQITNIGFLGVDLTIDQQSGPMLLEVNARAGLMVQIANLAPLGKRLERVEGLKVSSSEKGVRLAQDLFGEKVVSKKEEGKPALATREDIEIIGGDKTLTVHAILRPDYDRTIFDPSLIEELKEIHGLEKTEEETYKVKFVLGGRKMQTMVHAQSVKEKGVRASLGKRDLKDFLVDPGKEPKRAKPLRVSVNLEKVDHLLAEIDRKTLLLKNLRPTNLHEERNRAENDPSYNPVFTYSELGFDPEELLDRLQYIEADDSPMGQLLTKKKLDVMRKIELLQARGDNDLFTERSMALFGAPSSHHVKEARLHLRDWRKGKEEDGEMLKVDKVAEIFEKVLKEYGLREWRIVIKTQAVVDCTIGRKSLILRDGAEFGRARIEGLIAHEIETHVLTAENGSKQPYELFARGCAGYLVTQEGLAVFNEERVLPEGHEKRFWPALGTLAVRYGLSHSFSELRTYIRRLGFDDARALRTCLTAKRGLRDTGKSGAFTKGLVYFRGRKLIAEFLDGGGDIKELYKGKIALEDIELIRQVEGLIDPVYIPKAFA